MLGSISIAVNSLTGPAMLNLPSVFQKSGIIPTTLTIAFLCILSNLCSLHMANVISKVPGNAHFHREVSLNSTRDSDLKYTTKQIYVYKNRLNIVKHFATSGDEGHSSLLRLHFFVALLASTLHLSSIRRKL